MGIKKSTPFWGAAFLMATSAIGPGFITQTTLFTKELLTSFGFVILVSVLLDIVAQLNIWRIVTLSEQKAPDIVNKVLPGMGTILALMIVTGGLIFNIGNFAGTGMGLQAISGIPVKTGVLISAVIATIIFSVKDAGKALDWFTKVLGVTMIGMMLYVLSGVSIPVNDVLKGFVWPEQISARAIITLVGGTVGGYISFAGAHRLLEAGVKGVSAVPEVTRSSVRGILLATVMRCLLYLVALGVVLAGADLTNGTNPAAAVFQFAMGNGGRIVFGFILWAAAITSVVGCAYTSISFLRSLHPGIEKNHKIITLIFIWLSAGIFILTGNPVQVLVWAGTMNGFILPIAVALLLIGVHKSNILPATYTYPRWLLTAGWVLVIFLTWMIVQLLAG
ncbi:MAG: NRAMP family divalent metal transporter [Chitinophagaceae bacterium]